MKNILPFILIPLILLSCQEKSRTEKVGFAVNVDSLIAKNKEKDSVIDLMITQLNDLRTLRYTDKTPKNKLYEVIQVEPINDYEFAELINTFDTTISYWNGEFYTRIIKSCNGQSDLDFEYCNCSDNIYISTGTEDIPEEYYLYKVGPYMEAKIDSLDKKNMELIFSHKVKDKMKKEKVKINLTNVKIINN
ncbi:hypothetical protein RCC89_19630 [Cytophagaceae bacterium ABcell3]|nr:hypothetical protein RCC89_19630 [Cytophagaceae bacterium ABcell3]